MTAEEDVIKTFPTFMAIGIMTKMSKDITPKPTKSYSKQANRWWR